MELAAIVMQQVSSQQKVALAVLKQNAQAEVALANMIAQSATTGRNLDISV